MSREEAATAVANNDLTELLAADQLKIEQSAGNVFQVEYDWLVDNKETRMRNLDGLKS